jgi:hypothetical protein
MFCEYGDVLSAFNSFFAPRLKAGAQAICRYTVRTVSVDEYIDKNRLKPDFIKIDAESSESEILRGMVETLKALRPAVSVEVGDLATAVPRRREMLHEIAEYGYRLYFYKSGRIVESVIERDDEYDNVFLVPTEHAIK